MSPRVSASDWRAFVDARPEAHLLQTPAWAEFKSRFGWRAHWVIRGQSGAQVLIRSLPGGPCLAYVPKGPLGDWMPGLLSDLDAVCREEGTFLLRLEPDRPEGDPLASALRENRFRPSRNPVQPRRTILVSLDGEEADWLARMQPKTRYNIQLAARKGVRVHPWDDPAGFARMIRVTGRRQHFGVHHPDYYRNAYEVFHPRGECELLLAEWEGQPLAALMVFARGRRAWYFYGASTERERARMPAYRLQWEGMRWARGRGCLEYDLWGVPDEDEEVLESGFTSRSDGLWGVYRFKRGFGGRLVRSLGAWDRPTSLPLYFAFRLLADRSVY